MKSAGCNIAEVLVQAAQAKPEAVALVAREGRFGRRWRRCTFARLAARSQDFAGRLDACGIRRGQRVMLMLRPSIDFVALTFALFRLGAIIILIDPGMGWRNLLRCIKSVEPEALVGIRRAICFSRLFPRTFAALRLRITVSGRVPGSHSLESADEHAKAAAPPVFAAKADDLAAIIFTTGSTGPPKGVHYTHGIFHTQLQLIHEYFGIGASDTDQPGFTLFGLFSTALGARAVLPDMDPTRPAQVNPKKFTASILAEQVNYSFGSPAIWRVVSRYCLRQGIKLPLHTVLMAGAPVSGGLLADMQRILPEDARIFTPYGATETLPTACIEAREVVNETWAETRKGRGYCVGRAVPGMSLRIMRPGDGGLASLAEAELLPPGEIGEIVVHGPVVTPAYDHRPEETRLAKIADPDGTLWHRMGDMGYLDEQGRLWFCGRKAHRVLTAHGPMYSVCCEAIFNEHPAVRRSALVGLGRPGAQEPVIIVELQDQGHVPVGLCEQLLQLARANPLTREIHQVLLHPGFPVDIRHNAKIFREKLALWAAQRVSEAGLSGKRSDPHGRQSGQNRAGL